MGWTSLHREAGISNKDFFEREFGQGWQIVADAARRAPKHSGYSHVHYAAARTPRGEVVGVVTLMSWNPRDRFNFAYKVIDESMGPREAEAPASVLDALTPTDNANANRWRAACRASIEAAAARPRVRRGDRVTFARPLHFSNGYESDTFTFEERATFRTDAGFRVRIPGWRRMGHELAASQNIAA